jgi:hypothetical protein
VIQKYFIVLLASFDSLTSIAGFQNKRVNGYINSIFVSSDWTAEDYALMGGYQNIAAELKTPPEKMVMSFTEKSVESQRRSTRIAPSERSVSDVSLPPDQEHEKEVRALSVKNIVEEDHGTRRFLESP